MVTTVVRPPLPTENLEEGITGIQEDLAEEIEGLEEDSTGLGDAARTALTLARARCLLDPTAGSYPTWDAWITATQLNSAVFAAAATTEDHVRYRIAHKERTLKAIGAQWYVTPGAWITAFYVAAVCREHDRVTALCHVPMSLLRENGDGFQPHHYAWIETLRAYWLRDGDHLALLLTAAEAARSTAIAPKAISHLIYPEMELFHQFLYRDHEKFNENLTRALQLHRKYWEEEGPLQATGHVALGPLMMACFAYDVGMPVEVESEYLPIALIERNWLGEFPT